MSIEYDKHYQTENLFGDPYPELIAFYSTFPKKGRLLDLGCGQGRDAVSLARLGFEVVGIDHSKVGIEQLNQVAKSEKLPLIGIVDDIFDYANFREFDFLLLDSMFHFGKKEREKEIALLHKIFQAAKRESLITICIQKTGDKLQILEAIISEFSNLEIFHRQNFIYKFTDQASDHTASTRYEMLTLRKCN